MASKKYYDPDGHLIPTKYVPVLDRKKDAYAVRMAKKAQDLSDRISTFKDELLKGAEEIYNIMLVDAGMEVKDRKGNVTITSVDKSVKIEIQIKEKITFSDKIFIAQEKINEYLALKTKDVEPELSELVNSAFRTSKGQLDTKRVLGLFSLKIRHRLWLEAMELIKQSIERNSSKRYARIFIKDDDGGYQMIPLNIASI